MSGPEASIETGQVLKSTPSGYIGHPFLSSLRMKWLLFSSLLLTYVLFLVVTVAQLRQAPLENIAEYQRLQMAENAIIKADLAVFHVFTMLLVDPRGENTEAIVQYFSVMKREYEELARKFPERADAFQQLVDAIPPVMDQPNAANLAYFQTQLALAKYALEELMTSNRQHRERLVLQIRDSSDSLISTTLMLGLSGLLILGTISGLFQFGLTRDIRRLQARVSQIMGGYRGDHLPTRRRDELGQLILGVNQLANTLGQKEQELEIERRRSSYQEKMSAMESLAGGIAHEFNNPLSCIDGLAHMLRDELKDVDGAATARTFVDEIVRYTDGLTRTMRDLQALAFPAATDQRKLLDFNQLLQQTTNMLHFEAQKHEITFELQLDPMLPAVSGFEEQLSLAVTNILENALDELKQMNSRPRVVTISTRLSDSLICTIEDNGKGMDAETLARLFDPFFSTKPVGHGTGLGLPLCRATITEHGGQISITSQVGAGTRVEFTLPIVEMSHQSVVNG